MRNRAALRQEVQQIVRDVLNLEKPDGKKHIVKVIPYGRMEQPAWWPLGVGWDNAWTKGKMDAVYEAAFQRLRELCDAA